MSTVLADEPMTRTLFGYALMRDEHGEEMHKSKGNAIPFDEAADGIGTDVMRWMFMAQNPASNLNFGYGPGHEVVRRFFLPLWNTYAFFVTYARLDGWAPGSDDADGEPGGSEPDGPMDPVPPGRRGRRGPRRAGRLRRACGRRGPSSASSRTCRTGTCAATAGASGRERSTRTSAPRTTRCTRCCVGVTRLIAPFVPHLADAIWENLVTCGRRRRRRTPSTSPTSRPSKPAGATWRWRRRCERARAVAALGHSARAASGVRVRQPLGAVRVRRAGGGSLADDPAVDAELVAAVLDELNVKSIELIPDASALVERTPAPASPGARARGAAPPLAA